MTVKDNPSFEEEIVLLFSFSDSLLCVCDNKISNLVSVVLSSRKCISIGYDPQKVQTGIFS